MRAEEEGAKGRRDLGGSCQVPALMTADVSAASPPAGSISGLQADTNVEGSGWLRRTVRPHRRRQGCSALLLSGHTLSFPESQEAGGGARRPAEGPAGWVHGDGGASWGEQERKRSPV